MLGILLIDKPIGPTSHDVVAELRRRLKTRRVGHAGTLDPLATGLLVVAVGPATRFLQYLALEPKQYEAEITFGEATTTYDREGEATTQGPVPADLAGAIADVLPRFHGLIEQVPPMFSAVKVAGEPLYRYARRGEDTARPPRIVHIDRFEIQSVAGPILRAQVVCSGGTYIRTLADDLGRVLGCGAHLSGLRRVRVGRFDIGQSVPLADATQHHLMALGDALLPMPMISLDPGQAASIREGRRIGIGEPPETPFVALIEPSHGVFSVARVQGNFLQPECVIPKEAPADVV